MSVWTVSSIGVFARFAQEKGRWVLSPITNPHPRYMVAWNHQKQGGHVCWKNIRRDLPGI